MITALNIVVDTAKQLSDSVSSSVY